MIVDFANSVFSFYSFFISLLYQLADICLVPNISSPSDLYSTTGLFFIIAFLFVLYLIYLIIRFGYNIFVWRGL